VNQGKKPKSRTTGRGEGQWKIVRVGGDQRKNRKSRATGGGVIKGRSQKVGRGEGESKEGAKYAKE
jgi:hypothetical protein